jgi:F-type H+-transporting ATPase subunit epsilon
MALQLNIVSPEKELFNGEVSQVTLPGLLGQFTILPNHAPIVSSLKKGEIIYVAAIRSVNWKLTEASLS